jgi:putative transposase
MFVTTNTKNRRPIFANPAYASEAIDRMYRQQDLNPYFLFGFVVMPDHCHFLLNIPSPYTISSFMNSYKTGLTFDIGIGAFWQPRFDVRVPDDGWATLRYIHDNPVAAGLSSSPEAYPWSSASGKYDVSILP